MQSAFSLPDLLQDWHPPLSITLGSALTAVVYLRGFLLLRRTRPQFARWRAYSFLAGLAILWLALASPLETLADKVLTAHMMEHLLLMSAVPPLLWLGWPAVPLLRGIPAPLRRWTVSPLLRSRPLRGVAKSLSSPFVAWLLMNATLLLWHVPAAYDFALEHEAWHDVEHLCFLVTSLLFWRVVLRPWPTHTAALGWALPIYLLLADVVNTLLSAQIAFVGRPLYRFYLDPQNRGVLDPLTDQALGASLMWVLGSIAFLVPAVLAVARLLREK